ncbi:Fic family protein [Candidatus Beckwithbacteria bacterium]|nr:Fic family protein [Candidatus Beckwithbacteria bacterium]
MLKPAVPPALPPQINYEELISHIGEAHSALGKLNGILVNIPNLELLITPLLTKEAVLSSKIEGTRATMEDVYEYEAEEKQIQNTETEKDVKEIINYRGAIHKAIELLAIKPINLDLLNAMHDILLNSVRGSTKTPGKFRQNQVFIGTSHSSIAKALYIPPDADKVPQYLKDWEKYINSHQEKDLLVQIGVAHYQLEAIHPYRDGNGRIGRLIIPLFLYYKKLLPYPLLYISQYFENNRPLYYANLRTVDQNHQWETWLQFFLEAITTQALDTQKTAMQILLLYSELKKQLYSFGSSYAIKILDIIFKTPIVSFVSIKRQLNVGSNQTIYNLLNKFVQTGILEPDMRRKRNKVYIFRQLMEILR